jgi:hypothetical protein
MTTGPTKLEILRAQREAWFAGRKFNPELDMPDDVTRGVNKPPVNKEPVNTVNKPDVNRKAYMREYMRKKRAKKP